MAIQLDLDQLFADADTINFEGGNILAIDGGITQERSEFDGTLVESRLLLVRSDQVSVVVDQYVTVDGVRWQVDRFSSPANAGATSLQLIRRMS